MEEKKKNATKQGNDCKTLDAALVLMCIFSSQNKQKKTKIVVQVCVFPFICTNVCEREREREREREKVLQIKTKALVYTEYMLSSGESSI